MKDTNAKLSEAHQTMCGTVGPALRTLLEYMRQHGVADGAGEVMARLLISVVANRAHPFQLSTLAKLDRENRAAALAVIAFGVTGPWEIERVLSEEYGDWTKLAAKLPEVK